MTDPIQTQYHGDEHLAPKEAMTGMQDIRSSSRGSELSRAEIEQRRRVEEDRLAEDIIEECRVQLMLKFRFLDRALWRMELVPVRSGLEYPLATDGHTIYFDPQRVIARFRESFDESIRDYLHLVMHCIFRHPFDTDHRIQEAWSLTCDMIVESVTMDLCGTRFPSEEDPMRQSALDTIALKSGGLLPNKIYGFLADLVRVPSGQTLEGLGRPDLNEWHHLFERDDHHAWPSNMDMQRESQQEPDPSQPEEEMTEDDENPDLQADGMNLQNADEQEEQYRFDSETLDEEEGEEMSSEDGEDEGDREAADQQADDEQHDLDPTEEEDEDDWEEIAKEIEMNLETFSKEWGSEAGNLVANLQIANRRTYDYTDFLRRFMTITEQIKLNPEEFDYTYYTFGMDMYGNMPFIEPLEYKEDEAIRDFVIVIDTSESVKGDLVRKFIEHTFSILKESQDANTKVNVHIIQADSKVQSDLKITDLASVDRLMEGFQIRGFGGTDFRPAFDYVQTLQNRGELSDLKGLIYFTDGIGQFPEKPPQYDAAFVFVDDGSRELPPVPPWAMKVVIDERHMERMHA